MYNLKSNSTRSTKYLKEELRTNLDTSHWLLKLLVGNKNGPVETSVTEHLLVLKHLTLLEDHVPDGVGRSGSGIENLLGTSDESDLDLGRVVVGTSLDLNLTGGIGFFSLGCVALS